MPGWLAPLSLGAALHAGVTHVKYYFYDAPSGFSQGASLALTTPHLGLELDWTHLHDRVVVDPEDLSKHDDTLQLLGLSLSGQGHVTRHLWLAGRLGYGHVWERDNGTIHRATGGPSIGARVGYDVFERRSGTASVFVDADGMALLESNSFNGLEELTVQAGVSYRFILDR